MPPTTLETPSRKIILPNSPEETSGPTNMPSEDQIQVWWKNVRNRVEFKLKDQNSAEVLGSKAAKLCGYMADHLFPMHDVKSNTVTYMYNVAQLIEQPKELKNYPLPTFLMPVKDFHLLFIPA